MRPRLASSLALLSGLLVACGSPESTQGSAADAGPSTECAAYDVPEAKPLASLATLVVLGDSISAEGSTPTYADALAKDLDAHYGGVTYVNVAIGGAQSTDLPKEIGKLPNELTGPVAFVITAGGNDLTATLAATPESPNDYYYARIVLGENMRNAIHLLRDRFGSVETHIYWTNVFDPSDGQGNFTMHGCPFWSASKPTDQLFCKWNGTMASQAEQNDVTLGDLHTWFAGHGFNADESWFQEDCVHPNPTGHDHLRRFMYQRITGQMLP